MSNHKVIAIVQGCINGLNGRFYYAPLFPNINIIKKRLEWNGKCLKFEDFINGVD